MRTLFHCLTRTSRDLLAPWRVNAFLLTGYGRCSTMRASQPATGTTEMIKRDLVNRVIDRTGLSRAQSRIAVETILDEMRESMARGERIELRGFGVFYTRPRKTGIGRNPKTGEEVPIRPGMTVRFKPGKHMSES